LWVAQQLREATPYGQFPKYLIRDNDKKFGPNFARVATTSGIQMLRTPYLLTPVYNWLSRISWATGCGIIKGEYSSQPIPMKEKSLQPCPQLLWCQIFPVSAWSRSAVPRVV